MIKMTSAMVYLIVSMYPMSSRNLQRRTYQHAAYVGLSVSFEGVARGCRRKRVNIPHVHQIFLRKNRRKDPAWWSDFVEL